MQFKRLLSLGFFAVFCLFVQSVMAQNRVITGKITDSKDGTTLIGVTVKAGPTSGSISDPDGNYSVSVPSGVTTLVFSYTGYSSKTVTIGNGSVINVTLTTDTRSLNEVVVVGYGTQRIKDATGSVASLGSRDFNKGQISTPDQLLQGRIAGVTVTPSSGEPGAGAS